MFTSRLSTAWRIAILLPAFGTLAACAPPSTPEQQVRAVVAAGEQAAENRDHGALMSLVSADFVDADGGDARELSQRLRAYLVMHPRLELVTRIESLDFPYADHAQLRLTIGMVGQEDAQGAGDLLDVAADLQTVELELQLERDDWKVTRVEWDSLVSS